MALALWVLCGVAGCDSASHEESGTEPEERREVVVFAAASLTDTFQAIAGDFEKAHANVEVKLSFAGSQSLRTQIENGAVPEVFASADSQHMQALRDDELVGEPVVLAKNELVIVVPPSNPAGIDSLADLPDAERLVLAGEAVPAGAYAEKMLASASSDDAFGADFADRVHETVVSRETHVRQTLQKVVLGEADAAIVYATDAASAGDEVEAIPIPDAHDGRASYFIATLPSASRPGLGERFVAFVRSERGRKRLAEHGFRPAR